MQSKSLRWKAITESKYAWEREALEYVRELLPDHEPYRAWANFDFRADDGSINEVDLLVLAPSGFYLIEIKSHQGAVYGDGGTWTWKFEEKETVVDNPVLLANRKAKRLKSLLQRQAAAKKAQLPFLEAVVFLSATDLNVKLDSPGRQSVWTRDERADPDNPDSPPGIGRQLTRSGGGPRASVTSKLARTLTKAMDEAGIRQSQKARRVGDYLLDELHFDGATYQDWLAHHTSLDSVRRRVRIYGVSSKSGASRETVTRAAQREFQILEGIQHPGILQAHEFKEHELGPALVFEHFPKAKRLDHFLKRSGKDLSFDRRLRLFRQLAEILQVAHDKRLYHRALSPQSVLLVKPDDPQSELKIINWQTGIRESSGTTTGRTVSGTIHPDQLVEAAATAYMAPEVRLELDADGKAADLFSLGAIGYHLVTGQPPASNAFDLYKKLQQNADGLRPSEAADGVPGVLDALIARCTSPRPSDRFASVAEALDELDAVEEELTRPESSEIVEPDHATAGDLLEGGLQVLKRVGQGSTSLAFFVEANGKEQVLKLAREASQNKTLQDEAQVLADLHHQNIVQLFGTTEVAGRFGLLLAPIGLERRRRDAEDRAPRTLAESLHKEGPPSIDLLERFGEHLLLAVKHLEEKGVAHRDIKPDNLGIQAMGPNDALHLVLFDFSLARAPLETVHVGTRPYLDPFLQNRKRWDVAAERYAAAVTLHEMATGLHPVWGDGKTAPDFTEGEARIASDRLPTGLRKPLAEFFSRALRRKASERFDNADEMYRAWMRAFESAEQPALAEAAETSEPWADFLEQASLESQVIELGLSTRALNALERLGVDTVADLLDEDLRRITHQRGVGNKTRKEVLEAVRRLRARFPELDEAPGTVRPATTTAPHAEESRADPSVDRLVHSLLPAQAKKSEAASLQTIRLYLGLEPAPDLAPWCTQSEIARHLDVSRARVGQILGKYRERWSRLPGMTGLREDIARILEVEGGVMTGPELERAVLAARGSTREGAVREHLARAATRAALEVERTLEQPRWRERRSGDLVLVAREAEGEEGQSSAQSRLDYASQLAARADVLAGQDPLPSPAAVIEALLKVPLPAGATPLSHSRLVQLAAAASSTAAASPRLELYPRGLAASRALALSAATFLGAKELTPPELRARVLSRFPKAEPPPERPELDQLLREIGVELTWHPERGKAGTYVSPSPFTDLTDTGTFSGITRTPAQGPSAEVSEAQEFERRLERIHEEGRYFLLTVPDPRDLEAARRILTERFQLEPVSLDRLLIDTLKATAAELKVDWNVVLAADAAGRESRDWRNLQRLLDQALPRVETKLLSMRGTVLLTHAGLLARYERVGFLERFRDAVGANREAPRGFWVLVPGSDQTHQPTLDGQVIPAVTPAEYARVPTSWPKRLKGIIHEPAREVSA